MSNNQADLPLVNVPFVDAKTGQVAEPWFIFLLQLWRRTGSSNGMQPGGLTIKDIIGSEQTYGSVAVDSFLQALSAEQLTPSRIETPNPFAGDVTMGVAAQSDVLGETTQSIAKAPDDVFGDTFFAPAAPQVDGWTTPTLLNSWTNFGAPYNAVGYYRDPFGIVRLRGVVKGGTIGTSIFVLPVGYRPANYELLSTVSNSAFGNLVIDSVGNVVPQVGSSTAFSLDNMTFRLPS